VQDPGVFITVKLTPTPAARNDGEVTVAKLAAKISEISFLVQFLSSIKLLLLLRDVRVYIT
jgi:hypothetical protein